MRMSSKRWIKVKPKILKGTYLWEWRDVQPVLYFKTLEEVAEYFNLPNKQYVSDILKGRRGLGKKLEAIEYVDAIVEPSKIASAI